MMDFDASRSSEQPSGIAPLPRRGVIEILDLTFGASVHRLGAIALAALPVWVLIMLPWAGASWINLRWAGAFWEEMGSLERMAALGEDARTLAAQIEHLAPSGPLAAITQALNGVYILVSLVGGPLLAGALSCIVAGYVLDLRVGARGGWQGAARRGLELVFTEIVKAILLWLVMVLSILVAVVVGLIGSFALGAVFGGEGGSFLGFAVKMFVFIFLCGLVALGPSVYLFLLWIFTVPVVLFEKKSLIDALRESARIVRAPMPGSLRRSHAMRLTGLLTLVGLVLLVALLPAGGPWAVWGFRAVRGAVQGDLALLLQVPAPVFVASVLLLAIPQVLLAAVFPGSVAAYYLDARARMWGAGTPDFAPYLETLCLGQGIKEGLSPHRPAATTPAAPMRPPASAPPPLPPNWPDG